MNGIEIPDDIFNNEFFQKKDQELTITNKFYNLQSEHYKLKLAFDELTKAHNRLLKEFKKIKSKEKNQVPQNEDEIEDEQELNRLKKLKDYFN
jgi:seryl-tRNA synthetase